MKKSIVFLFVLFFSTILFAQNIVVESFVHLETDLTANLEGTTVYDQNGEKCALIKVRSNPPTKDFIFDLGVLGVVETRFDGPDIWLYVPYGVKKITIKHPQLGVLENYDLGIPVKKATTYQLNLRVGRVQTIVEEQLMKQFLMFRLNPKDAVVEVAGESWIPNADGVCRKMLSYGTYDYCVEAKDYHVEAGRVTLDNADETKVLSINLRPAYGWIEVLGIGDLSGAVVYVDNKMVGRAPVKTDKLSSGRHSVRIVKDLFRAHIEDVIVSDNQTASISPTLIGEFSNVSITTKSGAEIWVDGELKGISSWSGRLSFGEHLMETKLASHRSQSRVVNILPTESTKSVQLPEPQPIYGSLSVEVLPDFADIYIDGQKVGQTPKLISKILIGDHKVEVRAEGKDPMEQAVTIREGALSSVAGELKEETPKNQDELVFNVNGVQFTMKRVEGGTFTMGATSEQGSDAGSDEKPAHQVTLDSYYIGVTEVTQELWQAVMGSNPSKFKGDNLPVEQVTWDDCQQFIQKLNELTGQTFSLPTEAQWEFAARGGNMSKGYKYSGSNDLSRVAWYSSNFSSQTHLVAQLQPNELGLYDMSGNVWEWCSDWYGAYSSSSQRNPMGSSSGSLRVSRGGSCFNPARFCRVSVRSWLSSVSRNNNLGLRLVLVSFDPSKQSININDAVSNISSESKLETIKTQNELVFNVKGVQFTMKRVEGGTFTMGVTPEQDGDAYDDEKPAHQVTLDDYYIGVTEVTQALWYAVMGTTIKQQRDKANTSWAIKGKGKSNPMYYISWDECQEFIRKLNELTGQTFSLPTEAQWEFAARGGNLSKGYKYSGSNNIRDIAWYDNNSNDKTHPVAQKQPNELGLYDMSGNVSEWCQDSYSGNYYSSSPQYNPQGPSSGSFRVLRGGSWLSDAQCCRVSFRGRSNSGNRFSFLGLRLALVSSY